MKEITINQHQIKVDCTPNEYIVTVCRNIGNKYYTMENLDFLYLLSKKNRRLDVYMYNFHNKKGAETTCLKVKFYITIDHCWLRYNNDIERLKDYVIYVFKEIYRRLK